MKNILITGGAGFIGSNFIKYWLKKYKNKYNIINVDKLTYASNINFLKDIEKEKNYKFYKEDILNSKKIEEIIVSNKIDTIIHFAAETHVDNSIKSSNKFIKTNIEGTQILLDLSLKYNLRFHHISTDEVFGSLKLKQKKFNINSPYNPRNPYSASKAGSDFLVKAYISTHDLKATISNCTNNYGPNQNQEKFIPTIIKNIYSNSEIPVYGNGKNIRDWIYVEDHCKAIDKILHKGKIGEQYLIGGDNEIDNIDLIKRISKISKKEAKIKYITDRKGHDLRYAIDNSDSSIKLNWKPTISFELGIKKTLKYYQEI